MKKKTICLFACIFVGTAAHAGTAYKCLAKDKSVVIQNTVCETHGLKTVKSVSVGSAVKEKIEVSRGK